MKKILSLVLSFVLLLTLTACGTVNTINENAENNEITEDGENTVEWKQFLREYEEWVDKYIEITEKYKKNPSDMSILSDYTDMISELSEWSTKTADMENELKNASSGELLEYSAELAKIAGKLAQAAY